MLQVNDCLHHDVSNTQLASNAPALAQGQGIFRTASLQTPAQAARGPCTACGGYMAFIMSTVKRCNSDIAAERIMLRRTHHHVLLILIKLPSGEQVKTTRRQGPFD